MAAAKKKCPDCEGEMVEGFILDMTYGGQLVPRWIKGTPEMSFWAGGAKTKGKECRSVETYRCVNCGLLRSYATTECETSIWGY
ncbi:MAG TPA: PF20097 family protein [Pyrinomonadaceae bacterium]|nr:PF20097 family protein [Pyrinomonadaceae bacterium]